MFNLVKHRLKRYFLGETHIAPLVVFRIVFGGMMLASAIRFVANGWIEQLYLTPGFHFKYYGFEWVTAFGETGMYALFLLMATSALLMMLGLFYRWAAVLFFLSFTYIELIDKTYYLNHYYFISIVSFLMIWLPAHRYFSVDILRNPGLRVTHIPKWITGVLQLQLGFVYFYAGLAKLNYDWLVQAQPLSIWLPANSHLPVIGRLLDYAWVAYAFSWFGAVYDLTIPFWLSWRKTRLFAYLAVIIFHVLTAMLFQIGMFPYIMILATLIFFSPSFHQQLIEWCRSFGRKIFQPQVIGQQQPQHIRFSFGRNTNYALSTMLTVYFLIQILVPWRHLLYPGNIFWNEQGFRFSWRVMLMEKAGTAFFYVKDPATGHEAQIDPGKYLTKFQEKEMATQPDMVLQFAHFLREEYKQKGVKDPQIRVEDHVTLNGRGSRLLIDPRVDLADQQPGFHHKKWVLPLDTVQKRFASANHE